LKQPIAAHEVIARLADGSRFDEFKPLYGANLVTGWASIHGYPVGVLANNVGILFSEEAEKAAQFISSRTTATCRWSPAEHDRVTWSARRTSSAA